MRGQYLLAASKPSRSSPSLRISATAVCVLVGPVFILASSRNGVAVLGVVSLLHQYAFYQVIAAAVVYIIANLIPKSWIFSRRALDPSTMGSFPPSSSLLLLPSMPFQNTS
jgi:hypothetical protein